MSRKGKREKITMSLTSPNALEDSDLPISFHCFYPLEEDTSSYCYFQINLFLAFHLGQFNGAVSVPPHYVVILVLVLVCR